MTKNSTQMIPYLFFGGRCEEAIAHYEQVLDARLVMAMRYDQGPEPAPPGMLQAGFENKLMHAEIQFNNQRLYMSDGCDDRSKFDGFRLAIQVGDESDARRIFDGLADGGAAEMPLTKTFWSPCYGMVTDRFGVGWMVMVPGPPMP